MRIEIWWWLRCGETYGNGGGILGWIVDGRSHHFVYFVQEEEEEENLPWY
jgi:hypothetical protein